MVPDQSRWMKSDGEAVILQPPAKIDVIAGRAVNRVPPSYLFQRRFTHHKIAARDVFGQVVIDQYMYRSARSFSDTLGNQAVPGRRQVWAANRCMFAIAKSVRQIV